jgi:hypothetical protein
MLDLGEKSISLVMLRVEALARRPERMRDLKRRRGIFLFLAFGPLLSMAGCESPVTLYHRAEGGDIAKPRQPPPGYDQPYPNLASVPPAPVPVSAAQAAAVQQQLAQAKAAPQSPTSMPDAAAETPLEGLSLPGAPPPVPRIASDWHGGTATPAPVRPPPPARAEGSPPPEQPPILLAFPRHSAILDA